MKTKILKIGMPIMVFMLAIVFAFATEKNTTEDESLFVKGYILENNTCVSSEKECSNSGTYPCTDGVGGPRVHMLRLGESVCSQPLFNLIP